MYKNDGGYSYRGWDILDNGSDWRIWPPGAADGTIFVKEFATLKEAKIWIDENAQLGEDVSERSDDSVDEYGTALEPFRGKRKTFTAIFDRWGQKNFDGDETLLVQSVSCDGKLLASHAWLQSAENFWATECKRGEQVQFDATVLDYKKQLPLVREDGTKFVTCFGLYKPGNIKNLDREQTVKVTQREIIPPPPSLPKPASAVKRSKMAMLLDLERFADECGGIEELSKMLEFLRN